MNDFLWKIGVIIEEVLSRKTLLKTLLWSSDRLALGIISGVVIAGFIAIEMVDALWEIFLWMVGGIVVAYLFFTLLICISLVKERLNNIF